MNVPLIFAPALILVLFGLAGYRPRYLFFLLPVSILLFPQQRFYIGGPIYIYDIVIVVVIGYLFRRGLYGRAWKIVPAWHKLFLIYLVSFSLPMVWLRYGVFLESIWVYGHFLLALSAYQLSVIVYSSENTEGLRKSLFYGVVVSVVGLAILVWLQRLVWPANVAIFRFYYRDVVNLFGPEYFAIRPAGPFHAPTAMGGIVLIAGVCGIVLNGHRRSRVLLVAMAATAAAVFVTLSRHAMIAMVLGVVLVFFFSNFKERVKVVGLLLLGAIIGAQLLFSEWQDRFLKWDQGVMEDGSIYSRLVAGPLRFLQYCLDNPLSVILGGGLDLEKIEYANPDFVVSQSGFASNGFLLAFYYFGSIGFGLYIMHWLSCVIRIVKGDRQDRRLFVGVLAVIALLTVSDNYGMTSEPFLFYKFFILGALYSWGRKLGDRRRYRGMGRTMGARNPVVVAC